MRLDSINSFFTKRGGDLIILVFSLLLAFFMWSMHRMTKKYSAVLDYKVEINSNLSGRAHTAVSQNSLVLRGKSSGFFIFQQRLSQSSGKRGNIVLNIDSRQLKPYNAEYDLYYLMASDIEERIQEFFGNDLQLEGVSSDTLVFQFAKQANKKVPVAVKGAVTYASQYTAPGRMQLRPDSVVVYGDENVIDAIDSVFTQNIRESMVNSTIQGVVKLQQIPGVRFSNDEIYYSQGVIRYMENSVTVKLGTANFPSDTKILLVPQEVKVTFKVPFGSKNVFQPADFEVIVDYNHIYRSNVLRPLVVNKPEEAFALKVDPMFVECLVN